MHPTVNRAIANAAFNPHATPLDASLLGGIREDFDPDIRALLFPPRRRPSANVARPARRRRTARR